MLARQPRSRRTLLGEALALPAALAARRRAVPTAWADPLPPAADSADGGAGVAPDAALSAAEAAAPPPPAEDAPPVGGAPVPRESPVGPQVALTFDAGADAGYATNILDILAGAEIAATFGVTGQWAAATPDLVQRMAAEGHLLVNHTLDHRSFTGFSDRRGGLNPARRRAELEDADAILAPLIGRSTRPWYRLPYGDSDARVAADVAPAGYTRHAGWTVDSLGWQGLPAAAIVARCLRLAAPNAVYLLHVGRASQDGPALGALVTGLRERGFGFATLDDLGRPPAPAAG